MKNRYFLLLAFLLSTNVIAQNFEEITDTPFESSYWGSIAFADVDNDGDQDVLITGSSTAKLFTNDGDGGFTEVLDTPFEDVSRGSLAFADIDNDGDQDVLITGQSDSDLDINISKLYINDGEGVFTEVLDTPFDGVAGSSIAFADVDNDGDQDVLITGAGTTGIISKLYTNDGDGVFTEVIDTPFDGVVEGSIAFADVDDDGDQDVLITGLTWDGSNIGFISKLYANDGNGIFTEVLDTPFDAVTESSIAFADVDDDGDQDVLITGEYEFDSFIFISKLYTNDGDGVFTEVVDTPFEAVTYGSIAFADIDNDNDQDVLITGSSIAKLYTNDGDGVFTELLDAPFDGVQLSSMAFEDIDNDGDQDVLITGYNGVNDIPKLYRNLSSVGINENTLFSGISIYPNPVSDEIYISSTQAPNGFKIYNQLGQVLLEGSEVLNSINISALEAGNYILELSFKNEVYREKIVVY